MSNNIRVVKLPVNLDKPRNLIYDLNAMIELEEKYGTQRKAIEAITSKKLKAIRTWLWAGLVHEDEFLTEKQVGSMLSGADPEVLLDMVNKIMEALSVNLPDPKN
ncbi:hypothetical protein [Paenibacillus gallinarum]|uniref:Phage protein n=1 Tax=Paenibacillus gallinarum TaxID=2762232 RepID=A0ABR8SWS7_9BACL|nr:hypothetical protein [Paenibacillus gallinarum]MBD7967768.1 hypothetical protein [Paenibacillus gallinarum]